MPVLHLARLLHLKSGINLDTNIMLLVLLCQKPIMRVHIGPKVVDSVLGAFYGFSRGLVLPLLIKSLTVVWVVLIL